jgi:SpoIID/LytB domain protein
MPTRPLLMLLLFTVLLCPAWAGAQGVELSRADRLAILYTPQLQFAPGGEPLIKIGLMEGVSQAVFQCDRPFEVLPLGPGGPAIRLPARTSFTVRIEEGQPGVYRHDVVVASLAASERGQLAEVRALWASRGWEPNQVEVGSIFAVVGQRFDTRRTLVTVLRTGDPVEAEALRDRLTDEWGIDARVHSELAEYPGGTLVLEGIAGGVTIRHRDVLFVRAEGDAAFTVDDVPFDVGTRGEGRETRRYSGSLYFTADRRGMLAAGNETTLERLLQSVVPSEIYPSAPAAALQAQAVAARSELLTDLGARHLADPWMTCSDQRCQVYRGLAQEDARTTRAVQETRGQVLALGDQIIRAYYSSNNGGFAGSNAATWGDPEQAYLRARLDVPDPAGSPFRQGLQDEALLRRFLREPPDGLSAITSFGSGRHWRWTVDLTAEEVHAAVRARYPQVGRVTDLRVVERDTSGRITRLAVEGDQGRVEVERELNVRRTLGGLRSALFVMEVRRDSAGRLAGLSLQGAGFGHGVGLCQSGAIGAAERGWTWQRIVQHYYPGTSLRSLY